MTSIENVKIQSIERRYRLWEVVLTATVAGVKHEGVYEVTSDNVEERWFEPTGDGAGITEVEDDDAYIITDGESGARISTDDYAEVSSAARTTVAEAINELERQIDDFTNTAIHRLVA